MQEDVGKADRSGLPSVLDDLTAKEEELKQAVDEMKKQKETIQAAFQKAFGGAPRPANASGAQPQAAASKVVDLGVVGQGRRRINLAPVQQNASGARFFSLF